jgi:hypothetical protein
MAELIKKLDGARRQLSTAIELYFADKDLVSTWTLAAAAYNVVRDINRQQSGSPMMLKEQLPNQVPARLRAKLAASIQGPENFFKHADRDPLASIELHDGQIELLLLDATLAYERLTHEHLPAFILLRKWYFASYVWNSEDSDSEFRAWCNSGRRRCNESRLQYLRRMWPVAVREAKALTKQ